MKKFFRILLWTMVGVIFVGTFVYLYMNSRPKEERYSVVSPSRGDIVRSTVLTGTIEPRDEIEIKPQISGIISEVLVEAGDLVKEGDVIARIKVIPEASQLSSAQNRVDVAQIALDDAKAKYERSKMLFEKKVIAREEFETSEATYERAVKELAGARDAVRIVREGVSELNAKESNTMVRSTISGLVLNVPIKVGSSVILSNTFNDGTTIATVADMNNLIFKGNVDETEVGQLAVGMPMTISIGAMPEEHPSAVIEYISPKGTSANGANTFEIKAALSDLPEEGLRAGYSANATVTLRSVTNVLTVPESVVEYSGDSTFVYCLTDTVPVQKWRRTPVKTGLGDGISLHVESGIDSLSRLRGDKIIE
ncbi:MAG: efflux RND transporter periplasmic adaptor subunit [Muribaculaceae bacterium]|jgi:HlyD family secretion protein|nr:efflux RND transporter periplasmic adaptor subunit [Muribaculaceae bacterium]MCI9118019.1 efflux RND transporter periplasmic adaptor subunit [Muribaculaceae bacterium]